jgi:hypothetical protein
MVEDSMKINDFSNIKFQCTNINLSCDRFLNKSEEKIYKEYLKNNKNDKNDNKNNKNDK